MSTNYGKHREYIQNLIDEYNKTSSIKVSKDALVSILDNQYRDLNSKEPLEGDSNYKTKKEEYNKNCVDHFKNFFKSVYRKGVENFEKEIRGGKRDISENALKVYNKDLANLKGLLYSLASLSFLDHLDNKKGYDKELKDYVHNQSWKSRNAYDFDGNEFNLINSSLHYTNEEMVKASNYSISNLSSYVDYKANKLKDNTWHADTIKNDLKEATEKIGTNCKREDITDLIYKYKALEEKHNNRSFFSRLWHSSETKQLADAKEKLEYLKFNHEDLNLRGNKEGEPLEHWMARSTDPSYAFGYIQGGLIDEDGVKEYENKINTYKKEQEKLEADNEKQIDIPEEDLENENDLDKSFYDEKTHVKGLETAMEERINEIADDMSKDL